MWTGPRTARWGHRSRRARAQPSRFPSWQPTPPTPSPFSKQEADLLPVLDLGSFLQMGDAQGARARFPGARADALPWVFKQGLRPPVGRASTLSPRAPGPGPVFRSAALSQELFLRPLVRRTGPRGGQQCLCYTGGHGDLDRWVTCSSAPGWAAVTCPGLWCRPKQPFPHGLRPRGSPRARPRCLPSLSDVKALWEGQPVTQGSPGSDTDTELWPAVLVPPWHVGVGGAAS